MQSLPPTGDGVGAPNPWYSPKFLGKYLGVDLTQPPGALRKTSPLRCPSPAVYASAPTKSWIGYNFHFGKVCDSSCTEHTEHQSRYHPGPPMSKFKISPSIIVAFVDARHSGFIYVSGCVYWSDTGPWYFHSPNNYDPRHDGDETGGANYAFVDGSVQYIRNVDEMFMARRLAASPSGGR
jgi:prepilin-type processing-associated H-X9-DG protein